HGACPTCDGLGVRSRIDPSRVVPDPTRTLRQGAIAAFGRRGSLATASEVDRVVRALGVDPDAPWQDLPGDDRERVLRGTSSGKRKRGSVEYEGIVTRLERMLENGDFDEDEDELEDGAIGPEDLGRFVHTQTCETCGGSRLRSEALAVRVGGRDIAE